MTIIKAYKDKKVLDKKKQNETVIILTSAESNPVEQKMQIAYVPSTRSKCVVNVFLLIIAILVLSAGVIGGIFLYKYIANRHKVLRVPVPYDSMLAPATGQQGAMVEQSIMVEVIDINEENDLERIEVPNFAECRRSLIMHDFNKNYTVIVDKDDSECFIMDLDRNEMSPPKSFEELIKKYTSGYYMPKFDVVRHNYYVVTPALTDLSFAGAAIESECKGYNSYKLEKHEVTVIEVHFFFKTFGYSNLQSIIKDNIFKERIKSGV